MSTFEGLNYSYKHRMNLKCNQSEIRNRGAGRIKWGGSEIVLGGAQR